MTHRKIIITITPLVLVLLFIFSTLSPSPSFAHCSALHPLHCLKKGAEGIAKGARTIWGGTKKRAKMVYNDPLGSAINPIKVIDESIPSSISYVDYLIKNPDEIVKTLKNPVAGVVGMPVAMAISDGRNAALKNGVHPIPEEIKAKLSMYFDKRLLNSVRYAVGESFFNGLTQGIALNTGAGAITLVNVIVFKKATGSKRPNLWAHEMFHVRQYKKYGLSKFAAILTLENLAAKGIESAIEKPAYAFDSLFSELQKYNHITSGLLVGLGGKCMHAVGTAQTSRVVLSACRPKDYRQQWELTAKNEIRMRGSNNCLDVQWGRSSNRTPLHIWPCTGAKAQTFQLTSKGELRSALRKRLCVEVAGGRTADRTPIQVFDCNNSASQSWKKPSINLLSSIEGRCLRANGGSKGSRARLAPCHSGDPLQMWSSENIQGEMRLIHYPDKCLDVQYSRTANGTPLHIWPCNGGRGAQSFHLKESMQITTALEKTKCVDVAGNGNSIEIHSCRDNKQTQYWNKFSSAKRPQIPLTQIPLPPPSVGVVAPKSPAKSSTARRFNRRFKGIMSRGIDNLPPAVNPDPEPPALPNTEYQSGTP